MPVNLVVEVDALGLGTLVEPLPYWSNPCVSLVWRMTRLLKSAANAVEEKSMSRKNNRAVNFFKKKTSFDFLLFVNGSSLVIFVFKEENPFFAKLSCLFCLKRYKAVLPFFWLARYN